MDGVADNFTEGDGGARETREVRAREADKTRRKVDGVADNSAEVARKVRAEVLEKLKQRLKQKKTLPYWKYWKKTERLTKLLIILMKKLER